MNVGGKAMSKSKRARQFQEMESLLTPEQREAYLIEEEIRKRIRQRYEERSGFFIHLAAFIVFGLVGTLLLGRVLGTLPLVIMGFWAIGLVAHGISYLTFEMSERAIQREIEREREARYYAYGAKPKREDLYVLSEDGEIVPGGDLYDDEEEGHARRYR